MINTTPFRKMVIEQSSGTTRQRISRKNLEKMLVPQPSKSIQESIVATIYKIEQSIFSIRTQIEISQQLKLELINKIF